MAADLPVYSIEETSSPDIDSLFKLITENANWNISKEFLTFQYECSEMKTFNAVAEDGEIIGTCSMSPIENLKDCYMFTSFVVKECYRGSGIGRKLLNEVKDIVKNKNALVNAAENTEDMYDRKGYVLTDFHIHGVFDVPTITDDFKKNIKQDAAVITDLQQGDKIMMDKLLKFDTEVTYSERPRFLKTWTTNSNCTLIAMKDDKCVGYSCVWFSEFYRVGPLYAQDKDIASLLWLKSLEKIPNEKVLIEIVEEHTEALNLFSSTGLSIKKNKKYFNTRFNSGCIIEFNRKCVFALSSTDSPFFL